MKKFSLRVISMTLCVIVLIFAFSCSKDSDLLTEYVIAEDIESFYVKNLTVDDIYILSGNGSLVLDVLLNDTFDKNNVKITNTSSPNFGTVTINDDNTITYTKKNSNNEDSNEPSTDTFTYSTETTNEDNTTSNEDGRVTINLDYGELRAFPGAEGFGKYSTGGRGGKVLRVTNLNNSGSGSLREAIEQKGARTVVFEVSGYITITSPLTIREGNITIAGQTAPGDGITLRISPTIDMPTLRIKTSDVIIRGIRFRPGLTSNKAVNGDAITLTGGQRIIFDHCSFSWASDEILNPYGAKDMTFQNCIFSEGLMFASHAYSTDPNSPVYKRPHSMGMLIGDASTNITVYNSIFAHNNQRNPLIGGGETFGSNFELVNNVYYNWGDFGTVIDTGADSFINMINNLHIEGKISRTNRYPTLIGSKVSIYAKGNINKFRENNSAPELNAFGEHKAPFNKRAASGILTNQPYDYPLAKTSVIDPKQLLPMVTNEAGAFIKDKIDERIISDIFNGTGSLIDSPSDVGGYPSLASGSAYVDTDKDGMADNWETANNLDPNDPTDGNKDFNNDGFTNLEDFLHNLTQ